MTDRMPAVYALELLLSDAEGVVNGVPPERTAAYVELLKEAVAVLREEGAVVTTTDPRDALLQEAVRIIRETRHLLKHDERMSCNCDGCTFLAKLPKGEA